MTRTKEEGTMAIGTELGAALGHVVEEVERAGGSARGILLADDPGSLRVALQRARGCVPAGGAADRAIGLALGLCPAANAAQYAAALFPTVQS